MLRTWVGNISSFVETVVYFGRSFRGCWQYHRLSIVLDGESNTPLERLKPQLQPNENLDVRLSALMQLLRFQIEIRLYFL